MAIHTLLRCWYAISSDAGQAIVGKIKDFTGGGIAGGVYTAGNMNGRGITAGRFLKSRK